MLDAASASINGGDGEATERLPLLGGEGRSWRDWARTYRWYIAAGVGVGLGVTVAVVCGLCFGLPVASTPPAGNTTATSTTPDSTPATVPSSVGPTGSTALSTSTPATISPTSSEPQSSTGTMSTMTTGGSTPSSLCTSIDDDYGMELEMLTQSAVVGKETRVGNFEFGDTGLATIKVEGLKTDDVVKITSAKTGELLGSKTATSGEILEMDTFLRRPGDTSVDILIEPVSEGSSVAERNTIFTGTRGQGVVTCPLDLHVKPAQQQQNAHAFHGGIPDVVAASESTVGAVAGG
jgi:hypothetical protein